VTLDLLILLALHSNSTCLCNTGA